MRHRSRTEIVTQILEIANGNDVIKTKIMYHAFLGHSQSKYYLTTLTEEGLLRYNPNTHTFKTTEKGIRFLNTRNELDQIMNVS